MMQPAELLERLEAVRRRVRTLRMIDGVARLVSTGTALLLAAIAIDAWVRIPAPLRAVAALIGAAAALRWIVRQVIRPMRHPVPLREIAARLDARDPSLNWRLSAAFEHLQGEPGADSPLWRKLLDETLTAAERVSWPRLADARPARRQVRYAATLVGVALVLALSWPTLMSTGLPRFVLPFGATEWPRRVTIHPITRDLVAVSGSPVTVEMEITQGLSRRLKAWVVWTDAEGHRREPMNATAEGRFSLTSPRLTGDARYWFEAGDDSTDNRPGRVRVVKRPTLVNAIARATPPSYAARLDATDTRLTPDAHLHALEGSRIDLRLEWDKPAALEPSAATGQDASETPAPRLTCSDDRRVMGSAADAARTAWDFAFTADATVTLTADYTDRDGFAPEPAPRFFVDVRPDAPPRLTVIEPPPLLEVTPDAAVRISVQARDDIGISEVRLAARSPDGRAWPPIRIWPESESASQPREPAASSPAAPQAQVDARLSWALAPMELKPSESVEYWIEAEDAFLREGRRHDPARSGVMRLRLVAKEDLASRVLEEFATIVRRLQQISTEQRALAQRTGELEQRADTASRPAAAPDAVRSLATRQHGLIDQLRDAADHVDALLDRAETQHIENPAAARQRALAEALRRISDEPMRQAEESLRAGRGPASQPSTLAQASTAQTQAADRLDRLLQQFEQLYDLQAVVQKTRDLLDRQEAIARDTSAAAQPLAGRPVDDLSEAERQRLRDLAAGQDKLARDLADALRRIEQLAQAQRPRDRAAADALQRTRDAADRESVAARMQDAAEAIQLNRGMQAGESQQLAAAGLRAMVAELGEQSRRQLAELTRNLAAVNEQLVRLIETQTEIGRKTDEAAARPEGEDTLVDLSPRQTTLSVTAQKLAERVASSLPDGDRPAGLIQSAGGQMNNAGRRLEEADAPPARTAQAAALKELKQAATMLGEMQEEASRQRQEAGLAELREKLAALRSEESALSGDVRKLEQRMRETGRTTRREGVDLNRAAGRQKQLADRMEVVAGESTEAVVFEFVCQRIAGDMKRAAGMLTKRLATEAAVEQEHIVERITELLEALADAAQQPPSRFAEESGGSGSGETGQPALSSKKGVIPPAAQLKMLRRLQSNLNDAVRQQADRPPPDSKEPSSATLALGRQQQEIRDLARKLIDQARRSTAEETHEPEK